MMLTSRPRQERPHTYVVQDLSNIDELQRLRLQENLVTIALGGVLPEQPEPIHISSVLDVACGTGGWLIELAKTYPAVSHLVGVDISTHMIEAAQTEADAQQVSKRVQFRIMDALSLFEFSENSFDLVNLRFAASFLRLWEWPQVIHELRRVTRPGGFVRLTESDLPEQSSSPALLHLFRLLAQAYHQAGKYFHRQAHGVTEELAGLLKQQDIQDIQISISFPEIRAGTLQGQLFEEDMKYLFRTNLPFLWKWIKVPEEYDALYEQMVHEMQQPDFVVTSRIVTAWGLKAIEY